MDEILLYYLPIGVEMQADVFNQYLRRLPPDDQLKNRKYRQWKDRQRHLFGRVLLQKGLMEFGFDSTILNQILYTDRGRPYLNHEMDFNISHSGEYVIGAFSKHHRVGVDIEYHRPISFKDFDTVFQPEEWEYINQSNEPLCTFYKYWTIKEGVLKADGVGITADLRSMDIDLVKSTISFDQKRWYFKNFTINKHAVCLVANQVFKYRLQELNALSFL